MKTGAVATHTPGPWFVGAQNDALFIIDKKPRPSNDYPWHDYDVAAIAKVYRDGDNGIEDANANVLAAAPQLLAACKAALNDRMFKDWPDVAQLLIDAIAKAEGR
jgi:hypothetical protein